MDRLTSSQESDTSVPGFGKPAEEARAESGSEKLLETWVVVPAFNEEGVIRAVIDKLSRCPYKLVVVDDRSTDNTLLQIEGTRAHVLRHVVNLGQGAALQTGIAYALQNGAQYIVTFDSDGQHLPEDIPRMLEPLLKGECDVTLGTRFSKGGKAIDIPPVKKLFLKCATHLTRLTTGLEITDTHNGFRAFRAGAAQKLCITQNRMAHASQILSQIASRKMVYREVPTSILYTDYSVAKGQRMSNAFNIVWESLVEFFHP